MFIFFYMGGIFLGLGSNLGDRQKYLDDAMRFLEERGVKILKKSSVYETDPVGMPEHIDQLNGQPKFLNMAVEVLTDLSPEELLRICLDIENKLGRVRKKRWESRVIDIDVLLYQDRKIQTDFLTIPHPRMHEREFVMKPLEEIRKLHRAGEHFGILKRVINS